jgi:hypothetical protein
MMLRQHKEKHLAVRSSSTRHNGGPLLGSLQTLAIVAAGSERWGDITGRKERNVIPDEVRTGLGAQVTERTLRYC